MKRTTVFAKQPILDTNERIVAYELLYRDPVTLRADIKSNFDATVSLIESVTAALDRSGGKRYFINVDEEFLFSQMMELLTPEMFVLEILESVKLDDRVLEKIDGLRKAGFTIALDDVAMASGYGMEIFRHFDIVKIDLNRFEDLTRLPLEELREHGVEILAEKVEDKEQFEHTKSLGFTLFQGYFFAKPQIRRNEVVDPLKLSIVRILQKIDRQDSLQQVAAAIKSEPEVALRLLQYVNSAYFSFKQQIDTVLKAVGVLGIYKLRIWLYMLLYGSHGEENPLLELVRSRAVMMERLAQKRGLDGEKAYLTGLLSLLDVVLELEPDRVFEVVRVDKEIERAIRHKEGKLGELLRIVESIERGEPLGEEVDEKEIKEALVATLES